MKISLVRVSHVALAFVAACAPGSQLEPSRTTSAITAADARARIYAIADDSMKGREAGGIGNFMMTSYVAHEMLRLGLEPGGENGTWFQTIPMVRRIVDSTSTLSVDGRPLVLYSDFAPVRPTETLRTNTAFNGKSIPVV